MKKITVGISVFDQKKWLHRCLRSLASQTIPKEEFEVIIVNDSSSDVVLDDVCDRWKDCLDIKILNNEKNLGLPVSLNRILQESRGKYFVRVDADDYVSKHMLQILSLHLDVSNSYFIVPFHTSTPNENYSGGVCYQAAVCDYLEVDAGGRKLRVVDYEEEPISCGVMFCYEALCDIGFYDERFKMREGHKLMKDFCEKYPVVHVHLPLYRYRKHDENRTNDIEEVKKYDDILEKEK